MSLDNIQLPSFIISELYKDFLIDTGNQQVNAGLLKQEKLLFLGKNQKNILLIAQDENAVYLSDDDLNFLVDILNACRLSLADIALLNVVKNKDQAYESLLENFRPEIIIFFGVEPASLGFPLQFPHYQVQQYSNQAYLSAPPLSELAADKEKKKQLWLSLKKLFSI